MGIDSTRSICQVGITEPGYSKAPGPHLYPFYSPLLPLPEDFSRYTPEIWKTNRTETEWGGDDLACP